MKESRHTLVNIILFTKCLLWTVCLFFFPSFDVFLEPQRQPSLCLQVCSVCLFLYPLSCPVSPLLAQRCCGQAVLASSLIDNSQQGPSQGGRPDSLPPNTPGRLRAVVQAVNHRQLYRHHQALTGSYLPTVQLFIFSLKSMQALMSPARIHVNELLQSAKNNTFSLIATQLSSTVEVWRKVQDRLFYLYISFSRFLCIDQITALCNLQVHAK